MLTRLVAKPFDHVYLAWAPAAANLLVEGSTHLPDLFLICA